MSDYDKIKAKLDAELKWRKEYYRSVDEWILALDAALRRALEGFNAFERGLFSKRNADKISSEIKRDIAKILGV